MNAKNNCSFTGFIGDKVEINLTKTDGGTSRLFLPLTVTERFDGKTRYTNIPLVFFGVNAENAAKVLRNRDTVAVAAKFDSRYDKEAKKEWISFVVQDWSKLNYTGPGSDDEEDTNFSDEDEDEFPF